MREETNAEIFGICDMDPLCELKHHSVTANTLVWAALDHSFGDPKLQYFALQFTSTELAVQFLQVVNEAKESKAVTSQDFAEETKTGEYSENSGGFKPLKARSNSSNFLRRGRSRTKKKGNDSGVAGHCAARRGLLHQSGGMCLPLSSCVFPCRENLRKMSLAFCTYCLLTRWPTSPCCDFVSLARIWLSHSLTRSLGICAFIINKPVVSNIYRMCSTCSRSRVCRSSTSSHLRGTCSCGRVRHRLWLTRHQ